MFRSSGLVWILLAAPVLGQETPSFEVAEVKVNQSGEQRMNAQFLPGGQLRVVNAPMRLLITQAYRVRPDALEGAPGWLDSDRYDIIAKSKPETPEDDLRRMLQTLLAERFKLAVHKAEKVQAAYALTVGKSGTKFKPAEAAKPGGSRCGSGDGPPEQIHIVCQHITMAELAENLPGFAPRYVTMPVVDRTGLKGAFELKLDWTPMAAPAGRVGGDGPTIETEGGFTIFDAVAKLGLKMEKAKLPVPIIVIDHVERVPVDN